MIDDDLQRKSVVGVNVFLLCDVSGPQQWSLQLKGWVGVVGSNDSVALCCLFSAHALILSSFSFVAINK